MRSISAVLTAILLLHAAPADAELRLGMEAPVIRGRLLDGGSFDSSQHRGSVLLVNIWATWCLPCREEMPEIETLYRNHRVGGLRVIAISIDAPLRVAAVNRVMKQFTFPAALSSAITAAEYVSTTRIPMTFLIDRAGVLRYDGRAASRPLTAAALEKLLFDLLRDRGSPAANYGINRHGAMR